MPVPYTFATATTAIPLSQLDSNFGTAITLGNTAIQLGNTVTTLNNMTLANVTISSGTVSITNVAVTTANVSGTANISTLVVVGNSTMGGNVSVGGNVSISVNTSVSGNASVTGNVSAAGITASSDLTLSGGTANGVLYLNGSKVATSGSALVFDGTNLGIGVTPSAWSSGKVLEIGNTGNSVWGNSTANFYLTENAYYNGGWKYASSNGAATYQMLTNSHIWSIAPSGNAGDPITFNQAMTLDASGNLGVVTTSPSSYGKLAVRGGITVSAGTTSLTGTSFFASDAANSSFWISHSSANTNLVSDGPLTFWGPSGSGVAERARIDSSGNFLVYATTKETRGVTIYGTGDNGIYAKCTGTVNYWVTNDGAGAGAGTIATIYSDTTSVGSITVTASATAYNTSSDYRLKDNQAPLTGSGEFIDALQPKTWNWKSDGSKGVGFIAHEVQAVSPSSVVGEKDAVDEEGKPIMQAMEYGSAEFIANIIAELQSLRARVAQLESN